MIGANCKAFLGQLLSLSLSLCLFLSDVFDAFNGIDKNARDV